MQFRRGKTAQNGPQKMSRLAYLMAGIFFRLHLRQKKKTLQKTQLLFDLPDFERQLSETNRLGSPPPP